MNSTGDIFTDELYHLLRYQSNRQQANQSNEKISRKKNKKNKRPAGDDLVETVPLELLIQHQDYDEKRVITDDDESMFAFTMQDILGLPNEEEEIEEEAETDNEETKSQVKEKKKAKKKAKKEDQTEEDQVLDLMEFSYLRNCMNSNNINSVYRSNYFDQFRSLLNNPLLSDVVFSFSQSKQIYAHKLILITRSEYFRTLFASGMQECNTNTIELENQEYHIFLLMLEFMYTSVLRVTPSNIVALLSCANQYGVVDLKDTLAGYFAKNIDADTVCYLMEESVFYAADELFKICMVYVANNTEKILQSEQLKHLSLETFTQVLQSNALQCEEAQLFEGCIKWCKLRVKEEEQESGAAQNWEDLFGKVVEHIRFAAIDPRYLRDNIEFKYKKMIPPKYLLEAYRFHTLSSQADNLPENRGPRIGCTLFQFDSQKCSAGLTISNNALTVTHSQSSVSNTVLGNITFTKPKKYFFEFKVDYTSGYNSSDIMIGVTDPSTIQLNNFLSHNARGWAIYCNGLCLFLFVLLDFFTLFTFCRWNFISQQFQSNLWY